MPMESEPSRPKSLVKQCECGCGQPVAADKRFAARQCLAKHAQKFRKNRAEEAPGPAPAASTRPPTNGTSSGPKPVQLDRTMDVEPPEDTEQPRPSEESMPPHEAPAPTGRAVESDNLETVIEVLRYLRALPRDVRKKAIELLETLEDSAEF